MNPIEAEDPAVQVAVLGFTVILERVEGALAKLVYLSTLRDRRAGSYFHPSLSQVHGVEHANRALAICHKDLFMWLVKAPVSQHVKELDLFVQSGTGIAPAWRALESYRSTIPPSVPGFLSEIYFHNIESALLILQSRSSARM